jgi:hypothetical protein
MGFQLKTQTHMKSRKPIKRKLAFAQKKKKKKTGSYNVQRGELENISNLDI